MQFFAQMKLPETIGTGLISEQIQSDKLKKMYMYIVRSVYTNNV